MNHKFLAIPGCIALTLLVSLRLHAQQDPLYAQYLNNPLVLNPAYTGMTGDLNTSLSYRKQWVGLDGSPTTINASGHVGLMDNRMGAGLMIVQDKLGAATTTEVVGSYGYKIPVSANTKISFGLQAGFSSFKTDNSELVLLNAGDPSFQGRDTYTKPTLGAGVIAIGDRFMAGFSVPRLLKASATIDTLTTSLYNQHFYLTGAYLFLLSQKIKLKPSVLLRGVSGAPLSADLSASFVIHEKYLAGLFTRNFNTYGLLAQYHISDQLRIGYVFEMPGANSVGSNYTTHEITLGFRTAILSFHERGTIHSF